MNSQNESKKKSFSPRPLLQLLPALVVAGAIFCTLPLTEPVLADIPERLTASETAAKQDELSADAQLLPYADGTYEGSAQGYGGPVSVRVTISGGRITQIEILDASGETASFFSRAKTLVDTVLQRQSWDVDTVSGATYSSKGILGAIRNALTGQKAETSAPQPEPVPEPLPADPDARPAENYRDGVYTGSGEGYGGEVTVQVSVAGGRISAIDVLSAPNETPRYFERAKVMLANMLAAQSTEVDAISGATYSSEGLREAVNAALAQARADDQPSAPDTPTEPEPVPEPTPTPEPTPAGTYRNGSYIGTAQGYGGDIQVQVTVEEEQIARVEILSAEGENEEKLSQAAGLTERIVRAQSVGVDVISGATESSSGILAAARQALAQAEAEPVPVYRDGLYTASVLCTDQDLFHYLLQVDLRIQNGVITHLTAVRTEDSSESPEDNETYLHNAVYGRTYRGVWYRGVIGQVLSGQTAEVDTVSRATYSSEAILSGVRQALEQASVPQAPLPDQTAQPVRPVRREEEVQP